MRLYQKVSFYIHSTATKYLRYVRLTVHFSILLFSTFWELSQQHVSVSQHNNVLCAKHIKSDLVENFQFHLIADDFLNSLHLSIEMIYDVLFFPVQVKTQYIEHAFEVSSFVFFIVPMTGKENSVNRINFTFIHILILSSHLCSLHSHRIEASSE